MPYHDALASFATVVVSPFGNREDGRIPVVQLCCIAPPIEAGVSCAIMMK